MGPYKQFRVYHWINSLIFKYFYYNTSVRPKQKYKGSNHSKQTTTTCSTKVCYAKRNIRPAPALCYFGLYGFIMHNRIFSIFSTSITKNYFWMIYFSPIKFSIYFSKSILKITLKKYVLRKKYFRPTYW